MRKHLLLLASGNASRFGENKLLYPIGGKPLVLYGMETLQRLADRHRDVELSVVSRYASVRELAMKRGIRPVDSPDSGKGISYTIRAGIESLGGISEDDFLLFAVADQPFLSESSVERLLSEAQSGTECASLAWGERPGNPVLFSGKLIPELLALTGDQGGRRVAGRHICRYVQAESEMEFYDIDCLADFEKIPLFCQKDSAIR